MNRQFLCISTLAVGLMATACASAPSPTSPPPFQEQTASTPATPPKAPDKPRTTVTFKGELDRCEPGKTYTKNGRTATCDASVMKQIGTCLEVVDPNGKTRQECKRFDEQ